jgi:hypothetical protein
MSVPYRQILRMAARRVNAITGTNKASLESAYLTSPLTTTQIGNTDFTYGMIQDNLVSVIGSIVRAYAETENHPFRAFNISQTANIAHKGLIPVANSSSKPIVGVLGAIRDAVTGEELTKKSVQVVRSIVADTGGQLKGTYYYYARVGDRLYHTVANAVIDVCAFSASDELTSVGADGNAPIPDACLDLAWTGLVASLMVDDEYVQQASVHGQYFSNGLAMMKQGQVDFGTAPKVTTVSAAD